MKKIFGIFLVYFYFFFPHFAFAHEAYVLTRQQFLFGLQMNTANPFAPLFDTRHVQLSILITICVVVAYSLVLLWSTTKPASLVDTFIKKAKVVGPFIIRLAISSSFFYAAISNSILGPEISLSNVVGGEIIRFSLFFIALTIFLGIFVEISAFVGLIIFVYITKYYGLYMFTYMDYLGELLVLFLFGSRFLSIDRILFGKKIFFLLLEKCKEYEIPIVRILYGTALIYAGLSIKFQHQQISIWVYNQYHLKDFFHASSEFIAAGAGLSEILIGLFILFGFVMRFTILISLFFITISLLYFHELIWPHLMLYGISFSLLINSSDRFTIDHYMIPYGRSVLKKVFRVTGK